jgi:hypothetical protein
VWPYQKSPDVLSALGAHLPSHFQNWKLGKKDKQSHPLFLVCSSPGTGKSRLLQELPSLARDAMDAIVRKASESAATATSSLSSSSASSSSARSSAFAGAAAAVAAADPLKLVAETKLDVERAAELTARLQEAFVFNVSFENGTTLVENTATTDPSVLIGNRMMWQLAKHSQTDFTRFTRGESCTPGDVLERLSKITSKPRSQQTVFLLVDGLQQLQHTPKDKHSLFARALSVVANLVNAGPASRSRGSLCHSLTVKATYIILRHDLPNKNISPMVHIRNSTASSTDGPPPAPAPAAALAYGAINASAFFCTTSITLLTSPSSSHSLFSIIFSRLLRARTCRRMALRRGFFIVSYHLKRRRRE